MQVFDVPCRRSCSSRELKQPRRRQQKTLKFAYLTMKNSIFARFARAFLTFWHFVDVLVLSPTWNDLFCSCVDDVSIWWQMFNFVFLCPKRWFQFNSRIVRTHFSTKWLNNWKMIAERRSHIFRWRSRFRRRRVCLSSLISLSKDGDKNVTNLLIWQRKETVLHALHVQFSFSVHFVAVRALCSTWNDLASAPDYQIIGPCCRLQIGSYHRFGVLKSMLFVQLPWELENYEKKERNFI